MRLFIKGKQNEKVTLGYAAQSRAELARMIGGKSFNHDGKLYSVNEVQAEVSEGSLVAPAALGAFVGAFGGGVGLAIGGAIGALVGENLVKEDRKKAKKFNESTSEQ
jgi:hypothetical protein